MVATGAAESGETGSLRLEGYGTSVVCPVAVVGAAYGGKTDNRNHDLLLIFEGKNQGGHEVAEREGDGVEGRALSTPPGWHARR